VHSKNNKDFLSLCPKDEVEQKIISNVIKNFGKWWQGPIQQKVLDNQKAGKFTLPVTFKSNLHYQGY
jgi:hypothetical protein